MPGSYFKDFLEGSGVNVARPKNRGGNKFFEEDLPVIGTRAARVQYFVRDGRRVVVHESEKRQMDSRWTYIPMSASLEDGSIVPAVQLSCTASASQPELMWLCDREIKNLPRGNNAACHQKLWPPPIDEIRTLSGEVRLASRPSMLISQARPHVVKNRIHIQH